MQRFTRSGTSPAAPFSSLPPATIPAKREGARSLDQMIATGSKATRRNHRSVMQAAGTGRLESSWTTSPESADSIIFKNLRILVARSRNEWLNNDYAKQFSRIVKKNIVGANGFRLKSTPRDQAGKIDDLAKDAIEAAWKIQSRQGNFDTTGQMSRAAYEQLWISSCANDGEAFAIIVRGLDAGPTGFALQMIDSMRVDPSFNAQLADGRFIRAGIEYNQYGRPLAYHISEESCEVYGNFHTANRKRVDAQDVIHSFIPELVGQKRGIPWMHTALWRLRNIKGFEDAAVVNARVGAAKMAFFSDKEDLEREDDEDENGNPKDLEIDAEPGTFHNIGNRDFKEYNPQFPEQSMEYFMKVHLRGVASGFGVSYHTLANDLSSVNFSSLREGKLDERDTWRLLQEWMISSFEVRVFEEWIKYSLLAGTITVKGRPLRMDRREKYLSAEFKGRRWPWVDPKSEMAAASIAVDKRFSSRTKVIEEMNDGDAWDTFEEIQREEAAMKELGVSIPTMPGAGVLPSGKNPPAEDDDDDDDDEVEN